MLDDCLDVSFIDLGRRFDLYPASIAAAITRAIAEASIRDGDQSFNGSAGKDSSFYE